MFSAFYFHLLFYYRKVRNGVYYVETTQKLISINNNKNNEYCYNKYRDLFSHSLKFIFLSYNSFKSALEK